MELPATAQQGTQVVEEDIRRDFRVLHVIAGSIIFILEWVGQGLQAVEDKHLTLFSAQPVTTEVLGMGALPVSPNMAVMAVPVEEVGMEEAEHMLTWAVVDPAIPIMQ